MSRRLESRSCRIRLRRLNTSWQSLRTLDAVARFSGKRVTLSTHEARDGRRHWEGELLGPQGDSAGVRTEDGNEHWFEWVDVKSARLVVDPWADKRSRGGRK